MFGAASTPMDEVCGKTECLWPLLHPVRCRFCAGPRWTGDSGAGSIGGSLRSSRPVARDLSKRCADYGVGVLNIDDPALGKFATAIISRRGRRRYRGDGGRRFRHRGGVGRDRRNTSLGASDIGVGETASKHRSSSVHKQRVRRPGRSGWLLGFSRRGGVMRGRVMP